ncbi:hypothetical protein Hokovirus_2_116 [Hokovirus HKV1]|uniref:Uncharacterized protein n=1 Tax=Hokovirus HKV1 TaxID=1977638 RepID=A0A1V0SFT9_9VIRU|nr:hypothetical protein Hokovirus_2_116 [Hokovirus HKV1]
MNIIYDIIKSKYKMSSRIYDNILTTELSEVFYFDALNTYPLFPTILDFTSSKKLKIIDIDNDNNDIYIYYKEYKKQLKETINKLRGNFEFDVSLEFFFQ